MERYPLENRVIMGAVHSDINTLVRSVKPSWVPMTPDIKSVLKIAVCHYIGILWILPLEHELFGFKIDDEFGSVWDHSLLIIVLDCYTH